MPADLITSEEADRELLYEVLYALKEGTDEERTNVVKNKIPKLSNKQTARNEVIRLLAYPDTGITRGWAATALATLCSPEDDKARDEIINQLKLEESEWARYWMLLALYKMVGRNTKAIETAVRAIANDAQGDHNPQVRPLALVILTSRGDRKAAEVLESMLKSEDFEKVWNACRALEAIGCREMLEPLRRVAADSDMWPDARNRSVKALGWIESPTAAYALGKILIETRDFIIKESALEALVRLGKSRRLHEMLKKLPAVGETKYSVADSLLDALLDRNAQIRWRAAEALPDVMPELVYADPKQDRQETALARARTSATTKVVQKLFRETVSLEKDVPLLVDALRVIDPNEAQTAVAVLRDYLSSEDVSVKQRAEHALKLVGGEKAVQTLMAQKSEVLRAYNDLLSIADKPIQLLFEKTMEQAQISFSISQWMSVTIFIIGVLAVAFGGWIAFAAGQDGIQRVFGAGTSIIAVIAVLLDLTFRDPHRRVQEATSILLRTKVIFLGYVRQIHQVDATFKHEFIERGKDFGVKDAQETVTQISTVMKSTMDLIDLHLSVRKTESLAVDEVLKPWLERLETSVKMVEEKSKTTTEGEKKESETAEAAPQGSSGVSIGREQEKDLPI